jgi:hypothetical protein
MTWADYRGSEAGQDLFVLAMLNNKQAGTFLEIGGNHPVYYNNTWLLETEYAWTGVSIDREDCSRHNIVLPQFWAQFYASVRDPSWPDADSIDELPLALQKECRNIHRYDLHIRPRLQENLGWATTRPKTQFVLHDALTYDYSVLPDYFDYLQIDIEPPQQSLTALKLITQQKRFAVITFEHDAWTGTAEAEHARQQSREWLQDQGYTLVINDIGVEPRKPEDQDRMTYFEDWWVDSATIDPAQIERYRWIDYSGDLKFASKIFGK